MAHFPGEGTVLCAGIGNHGLPCSNMEIEGLEYCLHHVPDDLLDEAEMITGMRRCRQRFGEPDACRQFAVDATSPPLCKNHGAQIGSERSAKAASSVVQLHVASVEQEKVVDHWESIISAPPVTNPLEELQKIAGEIVAWKNIARAAVAQLHESQWRYTKSRLGEQIRAEILIYERALDRAERCLVNIAKLNIDQRLAAVSERRQDLIERAVTAALQASGLDLEGQDKARKVLRRELRAAS
jgi:hypothetical protein